MNKSTSIHKNHWQEPELKRFKYVEKNAVTGEETLVIKHDWMLGDVLVDVNYGAVRLVEKAIATLPNFKPVRLGTKPSSGATWTLTRITDSILIRMWGENRAAYSLCSFDFLDMGLEQICTPPNLRIYAVSSFAPGGEVYPIQKSPKMVEFLTSNSSFLPPSVDLLTDTYLVPEGIKLLLKLRGFRDTYIDIPRRNE